MFAIQSVQVSSQSNVFSIRIVSVSKIMDVTSSSLRITTLYTVEL